MQFWLSHAKSDHQALSEFLAEATPRKDKK